MGELVLTSPGAYEWETATEPDCFSAQGSIRDYPWKPGMNLYNGLPFFPSLTISAGIPVVSGAISGPTLGAAVSLGARRSGVVGVGRPHHVSPRLGEGVVVGLREPVARQT